MRTSWPALMLLWISSVSLAQTYQGPPPTVNAEPTPQQFVQDIMPSIYDLSNQTGVQLPNQAPAVSDDRCESGTFCEKQRVNEIDISTAALNDDCINYCIVGACSRVSFSLFGGLNIDTSFEVEHYNPDFIVSAFDEPGQNPWWAGNIISSPVGRVFLNTLIGSTTGVTPGGGDLGGNGNGTTNFKEVDVIGSPIANLPETITLFSLGFFTLDLGFKCDSNVKPYKPYYYSTADALTWRSPMLDHLFMAVSSLGQALQQLGTGDLKQAFLTAGGGAVNTISRQIGNAFPAVYPRVWGTVQPRTGFATGADAKVAAVAAQRAMDIVTYKRLGHISLTAPGPRVKENDPGGSRWQMLVPKKDEQCYAFAQPGSPNYGGKDYHATSGQYAWILWRKYRCCPGSGTIWMSVSLPKTCF